VDPREFFQLLLKRQRTNPTALAKAMQSLGRTKTNLQSNISRWLGNPGHSLAISTAGPIAEHLGINMEALYKPAVAQSEAMRLGLLDGPPPEPATLPGPAEAMAVRSARPMVEIPPASVAVPMLAVTASMGRGEDQPPEDVITGTIAVSADWIAQQLRVDPARLRFINGYGDSMSPTFNSGDVLLVDTGINSVVVDGIYVLETDTRLFIKRVRERLDGRYEISSDNPLVKTVDELDGGHQVEVLGRVVWVWNGRKV
jgi:hypothetical protein